MGETGGTDGRPRLALTAWALATLDVCLFVLLPLVAVHRSGALADLLSGLDTLAGVAAFGYLWLLFVAAVHWVLSAGPLGETALRSLALRGVAAGAVVGIAFLVTLAAVVVAPSVGVPSQFGAVALLALLGLALASVVGGVVGLTAALLDVALYRVAGALQPTPADG